MKSIQSNIKKAKKFLDNNHCVAVPTETVYGLAANAYSNSAVKKIFSLKKSFIQTPTLNNIYLKCIIENGVLMTTKTYKTKEQFFIEFKEIKEKEEIFINELREKYGDGQINIQEGTFTAVPEPV